MRYRLLRSNRKTISMEITKEGEVLVRAPRRMPLREIESFVQEHRKWLEKHLALWQENRDRPPVEKLSREELNRIADEALSRIPERVRYYASRMGVTYGRITIRNQNTRWGSCSAKGNLNFNCFLILTPPEVLDSVVVHELAHRKHMNHSKAFYEEVYRVYPEYDKWNRWLKKNGAELLRRNP